jgi:hypothetical protein
VITAERSGAPFGVRRRESQHSLAVDRQKSSVWQPGTIATSADGQRREGPHGGCERILVAAAHHDRDGAQSGGVADDVVACEVGGVVERVADMSRLPLVPALGT